MEKDQITDVYVTVSCTLVRTVDYNQAIGCAIHQGKFSAKTAKPDSWNADCWEDPKGPDENPYVPFLLRRFSSSLDPSLNLDWIKGREERQETRGSITHPQSLSKTCSFISATAVYLLKAAPARRSALRSDNQQILEHFHSALRRLFGGALSSTPQAEKWVVCGPEFPGQLHNVSKCSCYMKSKASA